MPDKQQTTNISEREGDKRELRELNILDPSSRTVEGMLREISHLKELLLQKTGGVEKAIEVAHEDLVRVPTEVQKAVGGLGTLLENKIYYESKITLLQINFIEKELAWFEKMRLEQKADTRVNVNDALKAASDVTTKSEAGFTKVIDGLSLLVATIKTGFDDKIADVKDLITESKQAQIAFSENSKGKDTGKGMIVALVLGGAGFLFGLISTVVLLIKTFGAK